MVIIEREMSTGIEGENIFISGGFMGNQFCCGIMDRGEFNENGFGK